MRLEANNAMIHIGNIMVTTAKSADYLGNVGTEQAQNVAQSLAKKNRPC
jgi:hypothetical protein